MCGSRGKYCPYECEGPPHRVLDALATTQVDDVEAKVSEAVVSLEEGGGGIRTVILHVGKSIPNRVKTRLQDCVYVHVEHGQTQQ